MTWVRVEPRSFDQGRHKNDAFIHSATLPHAADFVNQRSFPTLLKLLGGHRKFKSKYYSAALVYSNTVIFMLQTVCVVAAFLH